MFITIDGPNGSGKSTLVDSLVTMCKLSGKQVAASCEPTKSALGVFLRGSESLLSGIPLACVVAGDRYLQLETDILPALSNGLVAISDRYVESSFVFQSLDGVDWDFIWDLNCHVLIPDLSINLIALPDTLRNRLAGRAMHSRFERSWRSEDELALYAKARGFLSTRGYKFVVVDSESQAQDEICAMLYKQLFEREDAH